MASQYNPLQNFHTGITTPRFFISIESLLSVYIVGDLSLMTSSLQSNVL